MKQITVFLILDRIAMCSELSKNAEGRTDDL